MSARALIWAWRQQPATISQKLVLTALADRADDDGYCWPSCRWLAIKCAPMAENTVRNGIDQLTKEGLLTKVRRQRREDGTLGPWLYQLAVADVRTTARERAVVGPEPPPASGRSYTTNKPKGRLTSPYIDGIREVWLAAPGMIQHRPAYFDSKIKALIKRKVEKYGQEDVIAAITSYAKVLASDKHYFSHRWTLEHFLTRGLDRFVPEANPEQTFLVAPDSHTEGSRSTVDWSKYDAHAVNA